MTALPNTEPTARKALYAQIAEAFEAQIRSGDLKAGDRLPSQAEIISTFGVSQATARQAILNLTNQGLVVAQQGRGVFVAEPRIELQLSGPAVMTQGTPGAVSYEFISCDLLFAPERMARILEVDAGTNFTRCRRYLNANGRRIGMETANLPLGAMQSVNKNDLHNSDLRQVFCRSAEWQAETTSMLLSARPVTEFDAEFLGVDTSEIVIQLEEVTRSARGKPVLMTRTVYLAGLVSLSGTAMIREVRG